MYRIQKKRCLAKCALLYRRHICCRPCSKLILLRENHTQYRPFKNTNTMRIRRFYHPKTRTIWVGDRKMRRYSRMCCNAQCANNSGHGSIAHTNPFGSLHATVFMYGTYDQVMSLFSLWYAWVVWRMMWSLRLRIQKQGEYTSPWLTAQKR